MCRSMDPYGFPHHGNGRDLLKIKAFFLKLSICKSPKSLPNSLTLVFPPRINGNFVEIDGSRVRPGSIGFVTLHRIVTARVEYGSRDRVWVAEGVGFEVYMGEERVVVGSFRKGGGDEWKMECECGLEREVPTPAEVAAAEVFVAAEGRTAMRERVEMAARRRRRRMKGGGVLEGIPEEREAENGCGCSCTAEGGGSDGGDDGAGGGDMEMGLDLEAIRWAVDVGIWVVCLGVGILVSKASSMSLRRMRNLNSLF